MSASNLFLGGVPTKPDVDKLRDKFGIPKEGEVITWEAMENATGLRRRTHRFGTVVASWRRSLDREHNVVLGAERGKGLVCLPPDERVEMSADKLRCGVRMVGRGARIAATSDRARMTQENQKAADHINRFSAAMRLAMATSAKTQELPSLEKGG